MDIKNSLFVLILSTMISSSLQVDCNFTHFQFYSKYSLGKQEQLNQTFDQIQPLIQIPTISYKPNSFDTYNITDIRVTFRYLDSRQKAVIIGKDTIGIYGGRLQITTNFKWIKQGFVANINGTGTARLTTDDILFEKLLQIEQGYLNYKLAFFYDIKLQFTNFTLTKIDPPNTSDNDTINILNALNVDNVSRSLKSGIELQLGYYYATYLARNLKNQHYPLDDHFEYTWQNPWTRRKFTIPYMLIPTGVDLQPQGLSLTFASYIKDDPNWKCGKLIPGEQLDPSVYGGLQEFISFSVFENTVRYAFEKGFLNTQLNKNNWQSRFFQFFAGDLYQVIPEIAAKYLATQPITGNCTYNSLQPVSIKKHNSTFINATTQHSCSLYIHSSTKIAQFDIKLLSQVDVLSNETNLNFKITHSEGTPIFKQVPGYQIKNKPLAEHMVMHCLNRLREGYTFGSGWKIYPRDYSHVLIQDDYIVIYDSTHVEIRTQ